jgi:hypothetical protein
MASFMFAIMLSLVHSPFLVKPQPLTHVEPPMRTYEKQGDSITYERVIPLSDVKAFLKYMKEHYSSDSGVNLSLHKLSNNRYFGITFDYQNDKTLFLLFDKQGVNISVVSNNAEDRACAGYLHSVFFRGTDRVLITNSFNFPDGGFCGTRPYEYRNGNLKPLGEIPVFDGIDGEGAAVGSDAVNKMATAVYKDNTYYLTLIGRGPLYANDENETKLAAAHKPVTFKYDGTTFILSK